PYPLQVWRLGELTWIFLGGEVVVDYSLRLKRNLGSSRTWVSSYCNDVMPYIPSARVLKEGGYEGATAMIYYGQPTTWSTDVERPIIDGLTGLLARTASSQSGTLLRAVGRIPNSARNSVPYGGDGGGFASIRGPTGERKPAAARRKSHANAAAH